MASRDNQSPTSDIETNKIDRQTIYPDPSSIQNASLLTRLRARRITGRVMLVYAATLFLLVLAAPWAPTFVIGSLIVAAGLTLRIWSFGHLRKNQSLITTGPYAHTRNPAYLGSVIVMSGLFLAAGNPRTNTGIVLWILGLVGLYIFFTRYMPRKYRREYGKLQAIFGEELDRHAAHVPNFFPRITPWRSGDAQRFSWACVRANHEWIWPAASVLALMIMWFD